MSHRLAAALLAIAVAAAGCGGEDADEATGGVGAPRAPQEIQSPEHLPAVVTERVVVAEREVRAACTEGLEDPDLDRAVDYLADLHARYGDSLVQTPNTDDVRRTEDVLRQNAERLRECDEPGHARELEQALG
jgi:hypothetical protein